ncbi:MAG: hypothetical protein Q8P31_07530 [Bacillota bacterium]|nr:hypothetical protein [Bacillota bacterium]
MLRGEHPMCFGFSMMPDSLGAAGVPDLSYWNGPDGAGLELSLVERYRAPP